MNEIVKVNYDEAYHPIVSGRDLHEALGIETEYRHWFPRMCEYGFKEGTDYVLLPGQKRPTNNSKNPWTEVNDHQLTIDMAKEICMIQRTEIGKKCREYFLEIERRWNSPEAVMSRALQMANQHIESLTQSIAVKDQQIIELQPKASYYDTVLACKDLVSITQISKDYGWSARKMNDWLHEKHVQYKQGDVWLLYQKYADCGYTNTKTNVFLGKDSVPHSKVHTYWTQKGRLFIYNLMKEDGYYPLNENRNSDSKDSNSYTYHPYAY